MRPNCAKIAGGGFLLLVWLGLSGCGGSSTGIAPVPIAQPPAVPVRTPGIEHYTTDHNGFSRARVTPADRPGDAARLAAIDDPNRASPAGYRNIVEIAEARFRETTVIEVIAEITPEGGDRAARILRLTADQAPFRNLDASGRPITEGQFFFRGEGRHLVWARVDGGPLRHGIGDLENLVVDFASGSASINLRTTFDPPSGSDIETSIVADNLAFNIRTGAFGGPVTLTSRVDAATELRARGMLRGNITATPEGLSYLEKTLTTSGLYSVEGRRLSAEGVFYGSQPD